MVKMTFKPALFCLAAILSFSVASPVWSQDADLGKLKSLEGKIDIAGGTAHIPVMKEAAEAIMKANPKIRITVAGGGTGAKVWWISAIPAGP